jgi:hypothetical protein
MVMERSGFALIEKHMSFKPVPGGSVGLGSVVVVATIPRLGESKERPVMSSL